MTSQSKPFESSIRLRSERLLESLYPQNRTDEACSQDEPLIEPLSDREIEVLRLLNTELSGPEIADKLMVSLNTLHTHTKHIYGKLGVNNRRAAVRRAETLDLL